MDTEEKHFFYALLIAALIVSVILVVFTRMILQKHRKHIAVYKDKVLTEIAILEMERKRIASDLHDDIGPLLSSIKLQIHCLSSAEGEDLQTIERCTALITDAIQKVRETSNNLTPEILTRRGLVQAMREFSEIINKSRHLQVEIDVNMVETHLSRDSELHLYRIFQEVLNNCIKHSKATKFYLQLSQQNRLMTLTMRDNGAGFDKENVGSKLGLGLKNIANRVEILKGELLLDTQLNKGVQYKIEFPVTG